MTCYSICNCNNISYIRTRQVTCDMGPTSLENISCLLKYQTDNTLKGLVEYLYIIKNL